MKSIDVWLVSRIKDTHLFAAYMALAAVFVAPIIAADVYYADDILRGAEGVYNWTAVGRPAAEYVMGFLTLNFSGPYPDLGLFTQILIIPLLAAAGFVFIRNQYDDVRLKEALIGAFIILNPMLLGNISYRFDAFFMILGYFISILATTIRFKSGYSITNSVSLALYVLAFLMYQPIVFVAVPIIIFELYRSVHANHENSKEILTRFFYRSSVLAAATLFGLVITKIFLPMTERSSMVKIDSELFRTVVDSVVSANSVIIEYVSEAKWLYGIVGALALTGYLTMVYRYIRLNQKKNSWFWVTICLLLISPILVSGLVIGPMVFLQNQVVSWRVLPVFGVWLSILVLLGSIAIEPLFKRHRLHVGVFIVSGAVALQVVGMSFVYGTALSKHNMFMMSRTAMIANTINANDLSNREILMMGSYGTSGSIETALSIHPSLRRLIPYGDQWVPRFMLHELGYRARADMKPSYDEIRDICTNNTIPVYENPFYSIYDPGEPLPVVVQSKSSKSPKLCR